MGRPGTAETWRRAAVIPRSLASLRRAGKKREKKTHRKSTPSTKLKQKPQEKTENMDLLADYLLLQLPQRRARRKREKRHRRERSI